MAEGKWVRDGKSLFVRRGKVCFDVGWVGVVTGKKIVTDGKWRHIAFTGGYPQKIYVDGVLDAKGSLARKSDVRDSVLKLGHTSDNFPSSRCGFRGELDDVRLYARILSEKEIRSLFDGAGHAVAQGLVGHWPLDGDARDTTGGSNHGIVVGETASAAGRVGRALRLDGAGHIVIPCASGRPIPSAPSKFVVLGTPHCPQNGVGTVIRLDMSRHIRTREPMTYMTPYVDIRSEPGFAFRQEDGSWLRDRQGRGPLFKDPYPLSERYFLVSHKPGGAGDWRDPVGYGLYLLDGTGHALPIYTDVQPVLDAHCVKGTSRLSRAVGRSGGHACDSQGLSHRRQRQVAYGRARRRWKPSPNPR